jgi:hypothetical protein
MLIRHVSTRRSAFLLKADFTLPKLFNPPTKDLIVHVLKITN